MINYEIKNDLEDQRATWLGWFLIITFVVLFPATAAMATVAGSVDPILVGGVIVILAVSQFLRQHKRVTAASQAFIGGFLLLFSLQLYRTEPSPAMYLLFMLPLIVSVLLLDQRHIINLAVATIVLMFGVTVARSSFAVALNLAALPCLLCAVLAGILSLDRSNTTNLVYWATDIQKKDAQRAEMFYQQRQELSETLLQLTHAKSKLELTNTKLAEAQQKAEQASKAKSTFMSNMSHELRTPLNVVIGYSSSMLTMPQMFNNVALPDVHRPYLQLIEDNGHYLVGLINDILDLSKIEAGKLELHCSVVSLPEIFRGVIATCTGLLKGKSLQIRPDFPEDLPKVWADPMRVRQIILNLMSNAIKFTESGSVTLKAEFADPFVKISVIDTGIGIPEEAQVTIFDRFQQATSETDKHYGGTGLGLDISKQLSVMHGGDLTVKSKLGQGSIFTFNLPVAVTSQIAPTVANLGDVNFGDSESAAVIFNPADYATPDTAVILLVEHEVSIRETMHRLLETAGYIVTDTSDGKQGLELAAGMLPALIILDENLPEMSGLEVMKKLKADPEMSAIPVMICTDGQREKAQDSDAALFIKKPIVPAEFLAGVHKILTPIPVLASPTLDKGDH